jgi:hypothetical protein
VKKYLVPSLCIIAFIVVWYFTRSWKLSLAIIGILAVYIGFELGSAISSSKDKRRFESIKKEHTNHTENNPTLK